LPQAALQTENVAEKAHWINAARPGGANPDQAGKSGFPAASNCLAKNGTGPQEQNNSYGVKNPDDDICCRTLFEAQIHLHILHSSNPCSMQCILYK